MASQVMVSTIAKMLFLLLANRVFLKGEYIVMGSGEYIR